MKWPVVVGFLVVCLARYNEGGALKCTPGSEDASCITKKEEEVSSQTYPAPVKSELKSGKKCLPGSSWKSQCNQCTCSDDGYPSCTEIGCGDNASGSQLRCEPSTAWKDECNACWCTPEGQATCTRMECVNFENEPVKNLVEDIQSDQNLLKPKSHSALKRSVCKPNQEFQSDCNACKCAADGQSYTCTHNECLDKDVDKEVEVFMENEGVDHIEKHSVCKPRDTFYIGCNTCHCNAYGTDYTCTNKPCPLPEDVELFHELKTIKSSIKTNGSKIVCEANRMFIKDCNTCWCNEDGTGYFCTRRVCVQELPEEPSIEDVKPENVSLSRKVRALPSAQEPPKVCKPGQEFRMDCNKCLCDNEGQDFSCTRIDCIALNSNNNGGSRRKREISEKVPLKCVPGSVFDRDCNVCRCTQDGQYATCTIKRCQQTEKKDEDHATGRYGSGVRIPLQRWRAI